MRTAFLVQHSYEVGEDGMYDETKLIGIYSSFERAKLVVETYKNLPGFKDYADHFFIEEYELDKNHWEDGFVKM
ncbi:hypothetical protein M3231_03295 [Neobacillus mesonae]|nr:hypothetical protein [Neobacillus mesonae]